MFRTNVSEDFYQAQQLCLSLYSRYKRKDACKAYDALVVSDRLRDTRPPSPSSPFLLDHERALATFFFNSTLSLSLSLSNQSGIGLLFPRGDVSAGTELALTLAKGYVDAGVEFDAGSLSRVHAILDAYPEGAGMPGVASCEKFVDLCSRWCQSHGRVTEAKVLHEKLGRYTLRCVGEECAGRALLHSMRGNNLSDIVAVMTTTASRATPEEEDLIVVKTVLRFVNFRSRSKADLGAYSKVGVALVDMYHKQTGRTPPDTPAMNFLRLALEALGAQSAGLLAGLREKYGLMLGQDPSIAGEVDEILSKLRPRAAKPPDLSQMFKTLFA